MNEKQPLVSVVVPVYKAEKYLEQCLDSLSGQTLPSMEIICVNDGSPDRCGAILDRRAAADSRFKIIHQENRGIGAARTVGLEQAAGIYAAFVDADDRVEPETFRLASAMMADDESLDLVTWNLKVFGEPGVRASEIKEMENLFRLRHRGRRLLDGELRLSFTGSVVTSLFKMSLVKKYKICFQDFRISEDHVFLGRYLAVSRNVLFLDSAFYHYRRHSGSTTTGLMNTGPSDGTGYLDVAEAIFDFYRRHDLWPGQEDYLHKCFQKYFWLDLYKLAAPKALRNKAKNIAGQYRPWFESGVFYQWLENSPWIVRLTSVENAGALKDFFLLEVKFRWVRLKMRLRRVAVAVSGANKPRIRS